MNAEEKNNDFRSFQSSQPFQRFLSDQPASVTVESKVLNEDELSKVFGTFFEMYGFDPKYLVPMIKIVIAFESRADINAEETIRINASYLSEPGLSVQDRLAISQKKGIKSYFLRERMRESFLAGEQTLNHWAFSRTLYHELVHGIFKKNFVDRLADHLDLDLSQYPKVRNISLNPLDIIRIWLKYGGKKKIDTATIHNEIREKEFKKVEQKYGEEYGVLVFFKEYLSTLEEVIVRFMDEVVAEQVRTMNIDGVNVHKMFLHDAVFDNDPTRIIQEHEGKGYFRLSEEIVNDISGLRTEYHFQSFDDQLLPQIRKLIAEFCTFERFQQCVEENHFPEYIVNAVNRLSPKMGNYSQQLAQEIAGDMYQFLLPYHQAGVLNTQARELIESYFLQEDLSDEKNAQIILQNYLRGHLIWLKYVTIKYNYLILKETYNKPIFSAYSLAGEFSHSLDLEQESHNTSLLLPDSLVIESIEKSQNSQEIKKILMDNATALFSISALKQACEMNGITVSDETIESILKQGRYEEAETELFHKPSEFIRKLLVSRVT